MKFLLLICVDPAIEVTPEMTSPDAWVEEMDRRGIRSQGSELRPPVEARTVRVRSGEQVITDGPFAETKEFFAGFDIIECADLDEALAVAAKHPVARFGAVEVRAFAEE